VPTSDSTTAIEYRKIEGFPGYRVGSDGSVQSRLCPGHPNRTAPWHTLKMSVSTSGYKSLTVYYRRDGILFKLRRYLHAMVCEAFHGPCPPGMQCRHLNGDRMDNRPGNLAWGTRMENAADRERHGHTPKGSLVGSSKLTEDVVLEMRRLSAQGMSFCELSRKFGISRPTATKAVKGFTWKCVPASR
jgi:hypothetical protein